MRGWLVDFKRAWHKALLRPGFAMTVVLTIALAVASVSAIYALVDSVLLRAPDVPHAEQLVVLHRVDKRSASISWPDGIALREAQAPLAKLAVLMPNSALDWTVQGQPERLQATLTESAYFEVVSVPALLGRLLLPSDDQVGAPPVVVAAESFWRTRLAADPNVLGTRIRLSGVDAEIVGVAPARADVLDAQPAFWAPIPAFAPWAASSPGSNNFDVLGRLAADRSLEASRAQLREMSKRLSQQRGGHSEKELSLTGLVAHLTQGFSAGLWMLLAAVLLVLILAMVNVAALLLVQASGRAREIAVLRALGASGAAIFRQLLCEGLLLGMVGGALGLALAAFGVESLKTFAPADLPRLSTVALNWQVSGVASLLTLLASLGFSLVPALHLRGERGLNSPNAAGSRDAQRQLGWFIGLEVALAVLLLGTAALLGRSYWALSQVDLGFQAQNRVSAELVLPEQGYARKASQSSAVSAIIENLQATAGVRTAAFITGLPLASNTGIGHSFVVEGEAASAEERGSRYRPFHGDYIQALGLQLLSGRGVLASDRADAVRVAWVNQQFVKTYLIGRDPLHTRIAWTPGEASDEALGPQWMQIVGVVGDVRAQSLRDGDAPVVYAPYLQRDDPWIRFGSLVAHLQGDAQAGELDNFRAPMQAAVSAFDPTLALDGYLSFPQRTRQALSRDRFQLQVAGAFGLLAFLLGAQGIFGVVAYAVEQRRAELGVRLALGASPRNVTQLIVRWGLVRILLGALLGGGAVLLLQGSLRELLFGVSPFDPPALLSTWAIVLLTSGLALWIPARRAARVDPISALQR